MNPVIAETLPLNYEGPLPTETQRAYHAVVHLVVPGAAEDGTPITEAGASDYISETLRDLFLDWGYVSAYEEGDSYVQTPISITVTKPYMEGSFIEGVES